MPDKSFATPTPGAVVPDALEAPIRGIVIDGRPVQAVQPRGGPVDSSTPDDIPKGAANAVVEIVRKAGGPIRRRQILKELDAHGHRMSLAGLNRTLEYCSRAGITEDGPEGVRLRSQPR
ncbi:MAG: hypothetical protein L3K18_04890 [Thermoplasmata archaeon]|nr:hypothetical protein [Thermoplasmata archaeon]